MHISKRFLIISTIVCCLILAGVMAGVVSATGDHEHQTVMICHATSSTSNPYNQEHPNANADVGGHNGHGGDIIPTFDYIVHHAHSDDTTEHYPGKNWSGNYITIYNNGCNVPPPPPVDVCPNLE